MRRVSSLIVILLFAIVAACADNKSSGLEAGGVGGQSEGGSGGVGGLAGGGTGGDLDPGGTGGDAGGEEIEGPLGYVELSWDFPDAYGEMTYHVGKTEFLPVDQLPEACSGSTMNVVAIPAGNRVLAVRSRKGFVWRFPVEVKEATCLSVDVTADESESSIEAIGIGPGDENDLPVVFFVNGAEMGQVSRPFRMADLEARNSEIPGYPNRAIMEFERDGRLFVLPLNSDDDYPITCSFLGSDELGPMSGRIVYVQQPEGGVSVFDSEP